jgi:hypothetical protein
MKESYKCFCPVCKEVTEMDFHDSGHERDSSKGSREDLKDPNIIFSGLVRDVPKNLIEYLDKSEPRQYIKIFK